MRLTLLVHVTVGGLGLASGYVALAVAKGGPVHRKVGTLFVCVMTMMAITGMLISAVGSAAPAINTPSALLTLYLVMTSLTSPLAHVLRPVRRVDRIPRGPRQDPRGHPYAGIDCRRRAAADGGD